MNPDYDIAVIGGGIAGIAIAEIFSRDGQRVLLIEKGKKFCTGASAAQHGWFHFGSLYSIFPQNHFLRTMVSGVEDLIKHYSGISGMNIRIGNDGRLTFAQSENAWFRDEPIEYIIPARRDPDFSLIKGKSWRTLPRRLFFIATWEYAIKQFISRHRRFLRHDWNSNISASDWIPRAGIGDYSREVIEKPLIDPSIALDRDTHFQIRGYDRPMRSRAIATSLLKNFVRQGGEFLLDHEVVELQKTGELQTVGLAGGKSVSVRNVIVATGQWLKHLAPKDVQVKTVVSPLIIAYPAVTNRHFVRMTPFVDKSINHIWHEVDGRRYSVIGGGYYADPADEASVQRTRDDLHARAAAVFPQLKNSKIMESYSGFKTELTTNMKDRNYQYFIRNIEPNQYFVLPGKFSLSFSLAIKTFKAVTGREPPRINESNMALATEQEKQLEALVSLPKHASIAAGLQFT